MATQYRIGEFADLGGVSAKTLRFYDEIGLLRPAGIDPRTRYRFYHPEQLRELASIRALKDVGVSLADIHGLTRKVRATKDRREVLKNLKRTLEQSIRTARQSLNWINAALAELDNCRRPIAVVVKRRPAILVASIRSRVRSYGEVQSLEHELSNELPAWSTGGLKGVLWHRCADSGCLEGEPFIALRQRIPARKGYDVKQLPAATLACAYSEADDVSAEQAYDAIRIWMNVRGYHLAGPKRELYLERLLEIQFPLSA